MRASSTVATSPASRRSRSACSSAIWASMRRTCTAGSGSARAAQRWTASTIIARRLSLIRARSALRASTRLSASSAWLVREYCSSPSGEFDRTNHCAATHSRQSARPFGRCSASASASDWSLAGTRAPVARRRATCSSTCRCMRSAGTYWTSRSNTVRNTARTAALVGRDMSRSVGRSSTARTARTRGRRRSCCPCGRVRCRREREEPDAWAPGSSRLFFRPWGGLVGDTRLELMTSSV